MQTSHMIAQDPVFCAEDLSKTQTELPQRRRQMQVGYVKIDDFQHITRYNPKTPTVASAVNLVQSQVYHIERPPLFAARLS